MRKELLESSGKAEKDPERRRAKQLRTVRKRPEELTPAEDSQVKIIDIQEDIQANIELFVDDYATVSKIEQRKVNNRAGILRELLMKKLFNFNQFSPNQEEDKSQEATSERSATLQAEQIVPQALEWLTRCFSGFLTKACFFGCNVCLPVCPSPYTVIQDHEIGLISSYRKFDRQVLGGRAQFVNPFTDSLQIFDTRVRSLQINQQLTYTKDFVKVLFDACIYYSMKNPAALKHSFVDPYDCMVQLAGYNLKMMFSKYQLADLTKHFDDLSFQVQNRINESMNRRGIDVHRVFVKQVVIFESIEKLISMGALINRLAESRLQMVESDVRVTLMHHEEGDDYLARSKVQSLKLEVLNKINRNCDVTVKF